MKKDLISALLVAIVGVGVAYVVTGFFIKEPVAVSYKTVDADTLSNDLASPNEKVFNPLALNPTVEVYVGGCELYDANLGYYDEDGYFHKYEYDEEGFYDYNGYFFKFKDDGYEDEDGKYYRFDAKTPGYYDGAEFKDVAKERLEDEEDEDEDESDEVDDEGDLNDDYDLDNYRGL